MLVIALFATLLTTGFPLPAAAADDKLPAIVSLGDSFISGEGGRWQGNGYGGAAGRLSSAYGTDRAAYNCNPEIWCSFDPAGRVYGNTYVNGPDGPGKGCHRSNVAEILGTEWAGVPPDRRFNLACSGAVTADVTSRVYSGEAPQTLRLRALAETYHLKAIVLSIGGNDLNFSPIISQCAQAFFFGYAFPSRCEAANRGTMPERLATVRERITATVNEIRRVMTAAGQEPGTYKLIVQSYPGPIADGDSNPYDETMTRYNTGGCPFYNSDSTWARRTLVPQISDMIQRAVADARAPGEGFNPIFLDLQDAFRGHELCSRDARQADSGNSLQNPVNPAYAEWIRWVSKTQGDLQESIHPNAYGQQVLSRCLTILQNDPTGGVDFACYGTPGRFIDGVSVNAVPAATPLDDGEALIQNGTDGNLLDNFTGADGNGVITDLPASAPGQEWTLSHGVDGKFSLRSVADGRYLYANSSTWLAELSERNVLDWYAEQLPNGVLIRTDTQMVPDSGPLQGGMCLTHDPVFDHGPGDILGRPRVGLEKCDAADPRMRWIVNQDDDSGPAPQPPMVRPRADIEPNRPGPFTTDPASQPGCRPDGMTPTPGVNTPYCLAYDGDGRELLGSTFDRRVVGYFTGWRDGSDGGHAYRPGDIPWGQVTHVNYAFATVGGDNRISLGDSGPGNPHTGKTWPGVPGAEMDPSLPYQGNLNLLTRYKKEHPRVKTLISVGGWADSGGFYGLTVNPDGSVNQAAIDGFADSTVDFLRQYGFDGADIDYEYPTALPDTGNPADWGTANPRRAGLTAGYNALMKTLREKLDAAAAADGHYYLLTAAGSGSGYLVRGMADFSALQYLDFVNDMSYDLHGSWNGFVGPNAPLYDDGRDAELISAGVYDEAEYGKTGYFNADWSYHYYRGALQSGRINLGLPYYTRGWKNVTGGVGNGLWGSAELPDQAACQPGTGDNGGRVPCGSGATGVDNIWHDKAADGSEIGAGSNPMWHAKNLERGITPRYLGAYGLNPDENQVSGYTRHWDDTLKASWLWNESSRTFLSTEDEQAIAAKADYVRDKSIGGVMIWELAGDYECPDEGECAPGYTMTNLLDDKLRPAGVYDAVRTERGLPSEVLDVGVELVDYPTAMADMWPMKPKLRITNNTTKTLAKGTTVSFDVPTSTPALIKDGGGAELPGIEPGHTGPNAGGLRGDFHRVTITLGYCEDIWPGAVRDIALQYYLPITGPANIVFGINGSSFGSTSDHRKDVTVVDPPEASSACQAPEWDSSRDYEPGGSVKWTLWDKGDGNWQVEYKGGIVMDHHPGEHRAHLVGAEDGNGNQLWRISDVGDGWYGITNNGLCLTAGTHGGDLTLEQCGFADTQRWRLEPVTGDNASPVHGGRYRFVAESGAAAEAAGGSAVPGTPVLAGDPSGEAGTTVWWNGRFWRALWWTQPGEEPGVSPAWKPLT
ncbi:hypothetical protein Afil01_28590 [Actinorhabdospora filicis]|uniref:GH18 domain-containing protein n=2 Tax=Actinorhabdospora filicis TaxID=1785913 RepID=A0A9W6W3E3_9ACTN|nr:hypothetical protein Afil01_28590 [Actinorhabdospora filicis]